MKRLVLLAAIGLAACSGEEPPPIDTDLGGGTEDTGGGDVGGTDTTPDPDTTPEPDATEDTVEDIAADATDDADEDVTEDTDEDSAQDAVEDADPDSTVDPDAVEDTDDDAPVEDVRDVDPDLFPDIGPDADFDAPDFGGPGVCGDEVWDFDEECDGMVFDVCSSFGFESGELACGDDCLYDFSGCEGERPTAADCLLDRLSLSAACDTCVADSCATELVETFGGATFPPAEIAGACGGFFVCLEGCGCGDFECEDTCYRLDAWTECEGATAALDLCSVVECSLECTCGNGLTDEGEDCDTADGGFIFDTCEDLGYDGGELGCTSECRFDASECTGDRGFCGDGTLDWGLGEDCDGSVSETCEDLGFETGEIVCTDECEVDRSSCAVAVTRDGGTCEAPTVFEDVATVGGDGAMTVSDTLVGAGANHTGGCAGDGREVVFSWTPDEDGEYTISTAIGEDGDTVLYVRTDCADFATEVECNDDWFALDSRIFFTAAAGTTYFVFVDSFDLPDSSAFDLRIEVGRDEG